MRNIDMIMSNLDKMIECRKRNTMEMKRSTKSFRISRCFQISRDCGIIKGKLIILNSLKDRERKTMYSLPLSEEKSGRDIVKVDRIMGPCMLGTKYTTMGYFIPFGCDPKYKEEAYEFLENSVFKNEEVK